MMGKKTQKTVQLLALATVLTSAAGPAIAQEAVYRSGVERIVAADSLRMWTQRLAAAACLVDAGIDAERHRGVIAEGLESYEALLAGLEAGDPAFGIGSAEEDRKMLFALRGIALQWERLKPSAELRLTGGDPWAEGPDFLSRQNLNSMHAAKYLVAEAINTYAVPPALLQSDAFSVSVVARQRSLTQQMAKEACGVATGNRVMGSAVRLSKSARLFDASLGALMNGMAGAGVTPPPTEEIRAGLQAVQEDWSALRPRIDGLNDGSDPAEAGAIFDALDGLLQRLDGLMPLYIEDSKADI